MIEGLKVTVHGTELRKLCESAVTTQLDRVETYRQQIKNFQDASVEDAKFTGGDPIRALQEKLREHENNAREMQFVADHINQKEDYLLDWDALYKLGICKRSY